MPSDSAYFEQLRAIAEALLRERDAVSDEINAMEVERLLHELQVHQVELEVQNQQLLQSQQHLQASEQGFRDLFDYAPVGYMVLDADGQIEQVNFATADLLGMTRMALTGMPLQQLIIRDDQDRFYIHRQQLFKTRQAQVDECHLRADDGTRVYVQIHSVLIDVSDRTRVTLSDMTRRERSETRLERLRELDQAILRLQEPQKIIQTALEQLQTITHCPIVSIILFEARQAQVHVFASNRGFSMQLVPRDTFTPLETLRPNAQSTLQNLDDLRAMGLPSGRYRFVSIVREQQIEGLVGLGKREQLPDESLLPIAHEVAVQVGIAIYQARLFDQVQRYTHELEDEVAERTQDLRESEQRFRLLAEHMQDIVTLHAANGNCLYISPSITRQLGWEPDTIQTRGLHALLHPDDAEKLVLHGRQRVRLYHQTGYYIWFESNGKPSPDEDEALVTAFRNIQTQVEAEQERQIAQRFTEGLLQITRKITRSLALPDVLETVLMALHQVIPYDGANIMLLESETAHVVKLRGYDDAALEAWLRNTVFTLAGSPGEQLQTTRQPVVAHDIPAMPDWVTHPETQRIQSYVGAPIIMDDVVVGFINLDSYSAQFYTDFHGQRLQAFAQQAAIALHNAQMHAQEQTLAILQERHRIAQDLHDSVSQDLFAAAFVAETLLNEAHDATEREQLTLLYRMITSSQAEMRMLLLELLPERIERSPITDLVRELVENFQQRTDLPIDLTIDITEDPMPKRKLLIFRIVQEGLSNIFKHAQATQIHIRLIHDNNTLQLCIEDDGMGFDPDATYAGHHGIQNMRERAAQQGATLTIESQNKIGTVIRLTIKL